MNTLNLKVIRDIKAQKGMFLAVTFIIFLGIAIFSSFYMAYLNLKDTYNYFYDQTDFEDISIELNNAPKEIIKEIKKINGVREVEGRLSVKGIISIQNQHAVLKLISIPYKQPEVDKLVVVEGDYIPKNSRSLLLLKKFADYHNLKVGDVVHVSINDKKLRLKVAGLVYSPEYIWVVEGSEIMTSPRTLGIAFVPYKVLEELGYSDRINEVKITVYDRENKDEILNKAFRTLKAYNIKNYYTSEDQPSNKVLQMDLDGFKQLAILFPSFFLLISIFAVYVLLTRLIREQIGNIAVLRALGLSKQAVLLHYLKHSLFMGMSGSISGIIVGYISAVILTAQYTSVLNIPYYVAKPHYNIMVYGFLVGLTTPLISGYIAAKNAAGIEITQGLRGYVEQAFKGIDIEKFIKMPVLVRLSIRNLFRNKKRTAYSTFSVVASIVLILISMVFVDSMDFAMELQFNKVLNYDMDVKFSGYVDESVLKEIRSIKGVREAYPLINTWILIEKGGVSRSASLIGLENQNLYNIYDDSGSIHMPPPEGIILPMTISSNLSIVKKEKIEFFTEFGKKRIEVYDIFQMPLTPACYANLNELQRIMGIKGFNEVILRVDPNSKEEVKSKLENYENVLRVDSIEDIEGDILELIAFFYVFIFFSLFFGGSLGFASIFNTTTVNILERRREIATLKMLGYTTKELAYNLIIENLIIGFTGIAIGLPLGYISAHTFLNSFQSELYYMPFVIYPKTYFLTVILVLIVLIISLIPGIRYIGKMDIEKVTKEVVS